jgi:hypothetical protein
MDININSILDIIKDTKGRFFSIYYKKKDGSMGRYTARMGVKKYLRGGQSYKPDNSITVYSVTNNNKGYKTFLVEGIKEIRFKHNTIIQ